MTKVQTPDPERRLTGDDKNPGEGEALDLAGTYPAAQAWDLATIDLIINVISDAAQAYHKHADGLSIGLPDRDALDRAFDVITQAAAVADAARGQLFEKLLGDDAELGR